jgi:hypothetical protein
MDFHVDHPSVIELVELAGKKIGFEGLGNWGCDTGRAPGEGRAARGDVHDLVADIGGWVKRRAVREGGRRWLCTYLLMLLGVFRYPTDCPLIWQQYHIADPQIP